MSLHEDDPDPSRSMYLSYDLLRLRSSATTPDRSHWLRPLRFLPQPYRWTSLIPGWRAEHVTSTAIVMRSSEYRSHESRRHPYPSVRPKPPASSVEEHRICSRFSSFFFTEIQRPKKLTAIERAEQLPGQTVISVELNNLYSRLNQQLWNELNDQLICLLVYIPKYMGQTTPILKNVYLRTLRHD